MSRKMGSIEKAQLRRRTITISEDLWARLKNLMYMVFACGVCVSTTIIWFAPSLTTIIFNMLVGTVIAIVSAWRSQ